MTSKFVADRSEHHRPFLAALPDGLLDTGVPPCAITTIDDLNVVTIAATGHLA